MADPPRRGDPFAVLRGATSARIGLGRTGSGLPTAPMLALQTAHALARDAVEAELNVHRILLALGAVGEMGRKDAPPIVLSSAAADKAAYLQNPDLGRRLSGDGPALSPGAYDLSIVLADGLSARAVEAHAPAVVSALKRHLGGWVLAPLVIVRLARVAVGDPIAHGLGAKAVVVLIGERPGLSSPDSLSAYITWGPRPGLVDSERNCVSNIRDPGGLHPEGAAEKIAWLLGEARRLGFTGVHLKDRQNPALFVDEQKRVDHGGG